MFEHFVRNVTQWSTDRGIYEHSTAQAQALKAVSEVGELADAAIKNNLVELADAVGDVAVCLVNVSQMTDTPFRAVGALPATAGLHSEAAVAAYAVSYLACSVAYKAQLEGDLHWSLMRLHMVCAAAGLDFDMCCATAWDAIKDRKGHMVAGGAFVKEDV